MVGKYTKASKKEKISEGFAFISMGSTNATRQNKRYTHHKETNHIIDFCWDLHIERKNLRISETQNRTQSGSLWLLQDDLNSMLKTDS